MQKVIFYHWNNSKIPQVPSSEFLYPGLACFRLTRSSGDAERTLTLLRVCRKWDDVIEEPNSFPVYWSNLIYFSNLGGKNPTVRRFELRCFFPLLTMQRPLLIALHKEQGCQVPEAEKCQTLSQERKNFAFDNINFYRVKKKANYLINFHKFRGIPILKKRLICFLASKRPNLPTLHQESGRLMSKKGYTSTYALRRRQANEKKLPSVKKNCRGYEANQVRVTKGFGSRHKWNCLYLLPDWSLWDLRRSGWWS